MKKHLIFFIAACLFTTHLFAQPFKDSVWHGLKRSLRYHPEGSDFVITNGNRRFTRALYGTNTAFRIEAGDLPEFALYLPGMGGNIKFGLVKKNSSKWLIDASKITARYRPGAMLYEIEDPLIGIGKMYITVLAMADAEGVIIKIDFDKADTDVSLQWVYGGLTGKKFSRDGDMGPDPESVFYLQPEYCKADHYNISGNSFLLDNGNVQTPIINGIFPPSSNIKIANAINQQSPWALNNSVADSLPVITGKLAVVNNVPLYFSFKKKDSATVRQYASLKNIFADAERSRKKIAERIIVTTPDPYINTLGGAISIAADAIWEFPSYMHGAIGWRMRLNGWRGAYAADVLGWHDRARAHFRAYALSQIVGSDTGRVVADTALHLARSLEKLGTPVFSDGYISRNPGGDFRPHHYDMNLVFIDELLWHFNWTGDTAFVREMWPLLKRHLAWEKRNFDSDNDGLYDAYAAIWASDALQYSGGAVTHSSAYNYRANKFAAQIATILGESSLVYRQEADKIIKAINKVLWVKNSGWYAEYKDALGLRKVHASPALWTIYHSIDSDIADPFQAYQSLKYIDNAIPHIPIKANGIAGGFYTISTSNWMPYTWSLNNVALAELMHTSLANWQGGRNENAFLLWKSSLLESMYLGGSPGNFQQISTYDAIRGEAYRDFADPVGMTARSLIQGLFGILPDAMNDKLVIRPGFPAAWNYAALQTPDIKIDFRRKGKIYVYTIQPSFQKPLALRLLLKANGAFVKRVTVNNRLVSWQNVADAIDIPMIQLNAGIAKNYLIQVEWSGNLDTFLAKKIFVKNADAALIFRGSVVKDVYDPQQLFSTTIFRGNKLSTRITNDIGNKTAFVKIKKGNFEFWKAVNVLVKEPVEIILYDQNEKNTILFQLKNNSNSAMHGKLFTNDYLYPSEVNILANGYSHIIKIDSSRIIAGSNRIKFIEDKHSIQKDLLTWNVDAPSERTIEMIPLNEYFNDKVTSIFKNSYLSPRSAVATLQLPTQGIGDWTHPLLTADIKDFGFRKAAHNDIFKLAQGLSFSTPSDTMQPNIIFTSQWDNYPKQISIPLSGKAAHAYLLMAGSTNPMQSQFVNGIVKITYADGTQDSLLLKNPETWWPIEQDYYNDGYAFNTKCPRPIRVHLKTGNTYSTYTDPENQFNGKMIDGGAATVLDLVLDSNKTLQSLTIETLANDVVIGLMGVTLLR